MTDLPGAPLAHVSFTLDDGPVGDVRQLDGLQMAADIVSNDVGPDNLVKKHVSNVRWSPGVAVLGLGMGNVMAAWLRRAFAGNAATMSGSITLADANDRAQTAISFTNSLLTRCSFPALDSSSTDMAGLTIEFAPEQVRIAKGDGSDIRARTPMPRPWLCSGFKVEVGALPCGHVLRVEAMSWTCVLPTDQIGIFREPTQHPPKISVPDLTLTIGAEDRQAWTDAATAWFLGGKHLDTDEVQGAITLLGPDGRALARIGLQNMGFEAFQTLSMVGSASDRFVVSLYVESMSFDLVG